jgi:hypothetical protein
MSWPCAEFTPCHFDPLRNWIRNMRPRVSYRSRGLFVRCLPKQN